MTLTVLIAHRKAVVRRQLRRALEKQCLTQIVAECTTAPGCALSLRGLGPRLAILSAEIAADERVAAIVRDATRRVSAARLDEGGPSERCDHACGLRFPVDANELHRVITAARIAAEMAPAPNGALAPRAAPVLRVPIRPYGPTIALRTADCIWIESAGNSVRIHTMGRSFLLREKLHVVERNLSAGVFVRVSRRALVNVRYIEHVRALGGRAHGVRLTNGVDVTLSPTFASRLADKAR